VRRLIPSGDASQQRGVEAITDLLDLPLVRYPHEISSRASGSCDLAESLTDEGVPLLTTDKRFARAARAHTGIEVLAV
jgi:predicted nucleic acid-binding protein